MTPQPPHLVPRLQIDLAHEFRVLFRIARAGEHEVLPDEDPEPVALVVEMVVHVHAAAPDAQHLHVRVASRLHPARVALVLDRADERVRRDPVRPLREDRHAVQHEAEEARPRLVRVRRLVQLDRANADRALVRRDDILPGQQLNRQGVEERLAEIMRPPQFRLRDREVGAPIRDRLRVQGQVERRGPFPVGLRLPQYGPGAERIGPGDRLGLDAHRDQRLRVVRRQLDIVEMHPENARPVNPSQLDRLPGADRRQARPPVPAESELGLAHRRPLDRVEVPRPERLPLDHLQRRVELQREQVLAARLHAAGDVDHRVMEHVLAGADLVAVQENRHERIQPVENELPPLVLTQHGVRHPERDAIPPLLLFHPGDVPLLLVPERVGNLPGVDQCAMDITRDGDIPPPGMIDVPARGPGFDPCPRLEMGQLAAGEEYGRCSGAGRRRHSDLPCSRWMASIVCRGV